MPEFPAQQRAQRSHVHTTAICTTQGDAQHREMHNGTQVLISSGGVFGGRAPPLARLNFLHSNVHNAATCTTQGVAQPRELHNTGSCTTQGVAQRHSSLDIFQGGRGQSPPPWHAYAATCTTQGDAQHREMHNTGSCTTQGVAQHRELHNSQGVAQHREMHNTGRCTTALKS